MNDTITELGPSSFSRNSMLHKAIEENRGDIVRIWFNVGPATVVNAPNIWLQTPLHYSAMKFNTPLLEMLLAIPIANPKLQDINGFNVLHCYIYNILTLPHDDWRRIIEILLNMGIDVNQRTKYGYTVLHLACRYRTSPSVLRYLLESCHRVDKLIVNNDGENFLHTFVQSLNNGIARSEHFKEKFSLLEDIVNKKIPNLSLDILKSLLQQQNDNGATPIHLIISHFDKYRKVNAVDILRKMTSFADCATKPDNLGNHPIHIAIACTPKATSPDLLKMLVKTGNRGDSKNVFQQTAAHLVRTNEGNLSSEKIKSLRSLKKIAKVVFNSQDKWLSTPLMNISDCDPDCYYTLNEISDSFPNVNARDEYGASALHYAAYHDEEKFSNWLIEKSAKTDIKDKLGDTPLDTARRHLNFTTEKIILKSEESEVLYNIDQDFINDVLGLRRMKPIHMNADEFVDRLLQQKYRQALVSDEDKLIIDTIRSFVKLLCSKVEEYDSRFRIALLQSGSTSEGTKVGPPDEFDFLLCLDAFSEITEIVMRKRAGNDQNAALKLKVAENHRFLEYFDEEGVFTTPTVFMHLHKYLTKAMYDTSVWENLKFRNLSYVFEMPLLKKEMDTTVFMSHLIWMGCRHKQLRIKLDMVPVIRNKAWWPIDPWSLPLMSREIHDAGCLLMLDTKDDLERFTSDFMKETIVGSINHMQPLVTDLSVSTAPAEICLMRSLPVVVRESYALAKLLTKFCQEDDLTSYMLKNCVFYVLRDLGWNAKNPDVFKTSLSVREITILVLKKLLTFNKTRCLPRFFLPDINIFLEDDGNIEQKSRRQLVNFLLRILGVDVSLDTFVYESDDNDVSEDSSNSSDDGSDDSDVD